MFKQEFQSILKSNNTFLLIASVSPDFDSLCTGIILKKYLEKNIKQVDLFCPTQLNSRLQRTYDFLPYFDEIKFKDTQNLENKYDVIVFLDGANFRQFYDSKNANIAPDFSKIKTRIKIDHHLLSPEDFANITFQKNETSSTCEVLLNDVIDSNFLDKDLSTLAYAAIVDDTGNFRWGIYSSTFELASILLKNNADYQLILDKIVITKTKSYFDKINWILSNLEYLPEIHSTFLIMSKEIESKNNFSSDDLEELKDAYFNNFAKNIEGFENGFYIHETNDGTKISQRSNNLRNKINFPEFFKQMGGNGGGHFNASGVASSLDINEAIKLLKKLLKKEF